MNLLDEQYREFVQPTTLTKKLTLNGETKAYPIYRVRLELLYYNEQNDRIATWISQYKSEHGGFQDLSQEAYNAVIEDFIIKSNPASIEKTKNNIKAVNQREPGVILSDGRIVDGNRLPLLSGPLKYISSSFIHHCRLTREIQKRFKTIEKAGIR